MSRVTGGLVAVGLGRTDRSQWVVLESSLYGGSVADPVAVGGSLGVVESGYGEVMLVLVVSSLVGVGVRRSVVGDGDCPGSAEPVTVSLLGGVAER